MSIRSKIRQRFGGETKEDPPSESQASSTTSEVVTEEDAKSGDSTIVQIVLFVRNEVLCILFFKCPFALTLDRLSSEVMKVLSDLKNLGLFELMVGL
jgi:hypothetical protein